MDSCEHGRGICLNLSRRSDRVWEKGCRRAGSVLESAGLQAVLDTADLLQPLCSRYMLRRMHHRLSPTGETAHHAYYVILPHGGRV